MKKILVLPVLAAALLNAACGDGNGGGDPTVVDTRPSLRFLNVMTGMTASGGFTMNGQFVTGSALTFGQSTPCSRLDPGLTSFAFGAANTGGTALNGNTLATLPNETLTNGGDFIVTAIGNGVHSLLFMTNSSFSGSLSSNQAAVRFVNLAAATANPFNVMMGTSVHATNLELGTASAFATVPSGSTAFSILHGEEAEITGNAATLNLQGGSVNTVAIVRNGSMTAGFKLINLQRCN